MARYTCTEHRKMEQKIGESLNTRTSRINFFPLDSVSLILIVFIQCSTTCNTYATKRFGSNGLVSLPEVLFLEEKCLVTFAQPASDEIPTRKSKVRGL